MAFQSVAGFLILLLLQVKSRQVELGFHVIRPRRQILLEMSNRMRGSFSASAASAAPRSACASFESDARALLKGGECLRGVFLLKFKLAQLVRRHGQVWIESANLLKLFPRGVRLAGLYECSPVIQVRADVLRFERRGPLQMLQRRLRLLLLEQQYSQVQTGGKQIRRELDRLLIGPGRLIRLVQTGVSITQVKPGIRPVRVLRDERLELLRCLGVIFAPKRVLRRAQQGGRVVGAGRTRGLRGGGRIAQLLEQLDQTLGSSGVAQFAFERRIHLEIYTILAREILDLPNGHTGLKHLEGLFLRERRVILVSRSQRRGGTSAERPGEEPREGPDGDQKGQPDRGCHQQG